VDRHIPTISEPKASQNMSVLKLSDLIVANLPPSNPPKLYIDASTPGFGIRVGKNRKTFVAIVGTNTRRKVTLGQYPAVSLKTARHKAQAALLDQTPPPVAVSLREAFTTYLETYIKPNYRTRSAQSVGHMYARHLEPYAGVKTSALTSAHFSKLFDSLSSTPSEANHLFGVLRTFFAWCEKRDYVTRSPLAKLSKPYRETSRARLLTDSEAVAIYKTALDQTTIFSQVILLAFLSGQRRGELALMDRSWINPLTKTFIIPAHISKNGIDHTVPYTEQMGDIFDRCGDPLLFPGRTRGLPFTGFSGCKRTFDKACGVTDWTIHDMRRYFSSTQARLKTPIDITEMLLGHVSGSRSAIQRIYDRYDRTDECRTALVAFDAHITSLMRQHGQLNNCATTAPHVASS
jgi:integrase